MGTVDRPPSQKHAKALESVAVQRFPALIVSSHAGGRRFESSSLHQKRQRLHGYAVSAVSFFWKIPDDNAGGPGNRPGPPADFCVSIRKQRRGEVAVTRIRQQRPQWSCPLFSGRFASCDRRPDSSACRNAHEDSLSPCRSALPTANAVLIFHRDDLVVDLRYPAPPGQSRRRCPGSYAHPGDPGAQHRRRRLRLHRHHLDRRVLLASDMPAHASDRPAGADTALTKMIHCARPCPPRSPGRSWH